MNPECCISLKYNKKLWFMCVINYPCKMDRGKMVKRLQSKCELTRQPGVGENSPNVDYTGNLIS